MKYRTLDKNGDYVFGGGSNMYLTENEAVVQAIKTKILLFYGEWWEDISVGIPMFQSAVGKTNPTVVKKSLSSFLTKRIKEIPQVQSIKKISFENNARLLHVNIEVVAQNNDVVEVEVKV